MAGRKLFINDAGLDRYARSVMKNTQDNEEEAYADIIECKEQIKEQLKLTANMPKIISISIIEDGSIRFRTGDLFITTGDTGRIRKFFVGKWEVEVDIYGNYKFKSKNKEELGFRSGIWGSNTVHPHISGRDGHGCLGNAQTPLQLYLKTGSVKALAMFILGYLESVNIEDSAGRYLGACKEVKLDENCNVMHDENGNYIFIENEFNRMGVWRVSSAQRNTVDTIRKEYVTERSKTCFSCGNGFNADIMETVMKDGETCAVCPECKDKYKKCDLCGEYTTSVKDFNGVSICDHCLKAFFPKCSVCGVYIVPKDITKDNIDDVLKNNLLNYDYLRNTLGYTEQDGNVNRVGVCDTCKDIVHRSANLKDYFVKFKRAEVSERLFDVLQEIPVRTYKVTCDLCSSPEVYAEQTVYTFYNDKVACVKDVPALLLNHSYNSVRQRFIDLSNKYIKDNMIKIAVGLEPNGHFGVKEVPLECKGGSMYNKAMLTSEDKYKELLGMTVSSNAATKQCAICGKIIDSNSKVYLDKSGNHICEYDAANTYVKCEKCGRHTSISDLGINNNIQEQYAYSCRNCYTATARTTYVANTNDDDLLTDEDLPF